MWIGHKFVGASIVGWVTGNVIDAAPWICLSKVLVVLDFKSGILLSHVSCLEVKLVCVQVWACLWKYAHSRVGVVDHFTTCVINIGLVANYKVHSTVAKQLVFIQVFIYFHWHHGEHTKPHACVSSLIAHKI